jgi:hypothetical protein
LAVIQRVIDGEVFCGSSRKEIIVTGDKDGRREVLGL